MNAFLLQYLPIVIFLGIAAVLGIAFILAAVVLALFTLVASVFFHAYWAAPEGQAMVQQLMFFKNLAIVGGLLALAAHGAGRWSLDARRG